MNTEESHIYELDGIKLDVENEEFIQAVEIVQHTDRSLFLTGKAGAGKTTFLKYLKRTVKKKMVVLAPTGVAAINAGGQTIHSFFKIRPSVYVPRDRRLRTEYDKSDTDKSTIYDTFRYSGQDLKIIRGLEVLIIDEISMVRCDLLDVVDRLLRVFRKRENEPFGGVQIILIGDPFQLPPVIQNPEQEILMQYYENIFFFGAQAYKKIEPLHIELKKIYRQKEQEFIDVLNKLRIDKISQTDINQLNTRYSPTFSPPPNENYIILATHKDIANRTNLTKLEELPYELNIFNSTVTGDFSDTMMPTDRVLQLKENAQIMFVKNDREKRYFNGKIAKIIKIDDRGIIVELSEGKQIIVERETWENIKYIWNDRERKIEEEVIGTFTQYPIKLAWAITVHKSQGLSFEKVIADLGSAFAPGQAYVALSRCTTFNGLILRTRLNRKAIITAPEVLEFARNEMPSTLIVQELQSGRADFHYKKLREAIKQYRFEEAYDNFMTAIKYRNDIGTEKFKKYFVSYGMRISSYLDKYNSVKKESEQKLQKLSTNFIQIAHAEQEAKVRIAELENILAEREVTIKNLETDLANRGRENKRLDHKNRIQESDLQAIRSINKEYEAEISSLFYEINRLNKLKWYHKLVGKR